MTLIIKSKNFFSLIIAFALLTDLAIILNIQFLRQFFALIFLLILPGTLILQIIKIDKLELIEKLVLSVGLSVSFVMLIGLFINEIYFSIGYKYPLSKSSLIISLSAALFFLSFWAFKRNSLKNFIITRPNLEIDIEMLFFIPLILLPLLSVLGTNLINKCDDNLISLLVLFLIPLYIIIIASFGDSTPKQIYPFSLLMISVSLLFLGSLRGDYFLSGGDINDEYYAFQLALNNHHWSMDSLWAGFNACLSVTILPTIFNEFLSFDVYIFKFCYPLVFSITPLTLYILYKKLFFSELVAFLSSCFFMSQLIYTHMIFNWARVEVAIFFLALAFMVLLDPEIDEIKKRFLFLIFMVSLLFSHYSSVYITLIILILSALILFLHDTYSSSHSNRIINKGVIAIIFAMIFVWYGQLTQVSFNQLIYFSIDAILELQHLFLEEARADTTLKLLGVSNNLLPEKISYLVHLISFMLIGVGVFSLIKNNGYRLNEYLSFVISCAILLIFVEFLPYLSQGYDMIRTYQLAIIILAPTFVIGCITISRLLKQNFKLFILFFLILQFIGANLLIYQFFDVPYSMLYNSEGKQYIQEYVHSEDILMARWLNRLKGESPICFDSGSRFTHSIGLFENINNSFAFNNTSAEEYICLRHRSVVDGKILVEWDHIDDISKYAHLFTGKGKIYENGGALIYK